MAKYYKNLKFEACVSVFVLRSETANHAMVVSTFSVLIQKISIFVAY